MKNQMVSYYSQFQRKSWILGLFGAVLIRFTVGWVFLASGWWKLHNLQQVTGFFTSLGIPLAIVQAPMVSCFEFLGGLFILVGFLTRLAAIPLIVIMMVALLTAHSGEIHSLKDLLDQTPFLYAVMLLGLLGQGPGKFSVDSVLGLE